MIQSIFRLIDRAKYIYHWQEKGWLIAYFGESSICHFINEDGETLEVDIKNESNIHDITEDNFIYALENYIEKHNKTLEDIEAEEEDYYERKKQESYHEDDFDYIEIN